MKHFTWKRIKCSVIKRKTISSIKYICNNKKQKNLYKLMPMNPININQQIITLDIQKTPDSDICFLSIFELNIRVFDEIYVYLIIHSAVIFPA